MRRGEMTQALALSQRVINEEQPPLRQVAKPAVNQLRGSRGGRAGEISGLDQRDIETAHRGVARDRDPVDTAADDAQIELLVREARQAFIARESGLDEVSQSSPSS
jgi:hypothetical protein